MQLLSVGQIKTVVFDPFQKCVDLFGLEFGLRLEFFQVVECFQNYSGRLTTSCPALLLAIKI